MDGLCSREVGGQLMCAYREMDSVQYHNDVLGQPTERTDKMAIEAGMCTTALSDRLIILCLHVRGMFLMVPLVHGVQ